MLQLTKAAFACLRALTPIGTERTIREIISLARIPEGTAYDTLWRLERAEGIVSSRLAYLPEGGRRRRLYRINSLHPLISAREDTINDPTA